MENKNKRVHLKIWIQCQTGETLFGEGQISILEAIEKEGSINGAAKSMGMGYRSMWGRLKKIENRIGTPLLIRRKGGLSGGRSTLTPDVLQMIEKFKRLQQQFNKAAEIMYHEIFAKFAKED